MDDKAQGFSPFAVAADATLSAPWLRWLATALTDRPTPLSAPPAADWQEVMPALHGHGVLPMLYPRLRRSERWQELAATTQAALADAFRFNAIRTFLLDEELARIGTSLAADGIPMMMLKGLATARLLYGSAAERTVNDMDLLVPQADVGRALKLLRGLGYQQQGLTVVGAWQRRYHCEVALVGAQRLLVEVHWSLVESPYHIDRIDMATVWRGRKPAAHLPNAWTPDPATLLVHSAAHLALHHSRQLRLVWLVDLDRLARLPQMDWDEVLNRAQQWRLELAVQAALAATTRWLETPMPASVAASLAASAVDPAGSILWGVGDERPGRAWQRARATWALLSPRQRLRYAAWVGVRTLARPLEAASRRADLPRTPPAERQEGIRP